MSERLMIIDGNSIINRAYYGVKPLSTKNGTPTNAIFGFLNILLKYVQELEPDYICVAFDLPKPTFRHKMYEQYKAQRKKMPDELAAQMPIAKDILAAMNIHILEKEGYEADDIIGTVSALCDARGTECMIITGDRDDLQLATDTTKIYLTTTRKGNTVTDIYDKAAVAEHYGVTPDEFIDVKALMGDSSDNIPGVAGIGEKTALALVQKAKSIEALYESPEQYGAKGAVLKKLEAGRESAFLSKELATIDKAVPLECDISEMKRREYDTKRLYNILEELEFKSFVKKLGLTAENTSESGRDGIEINVKANIVSDASELEALAQAAVEDGQLVYRLYTTDGRIDALAVYVRGEAHYAPTGLFLNESTICGVFASVFENGDVKKLAHGIKDDMVTLNSMGIGYGGAGFDTMLGAYIVDASRTAYEISELASEYLGAQLCSEEDFLGKGRKKLRICETDENEAALFAAKQLFCIDRLRKYIDEELVKKGQSELYYDIELPLVNVLADMQITGMAIDKNSLVEFNKALASRIDELTEKIYELAGGEFNINSTKQLGEVLFEKLGLKAVKKTKRGYSTDAAVLEKLSGSHEIIEHITEYRLVNKLKTTYGDGLLSVISPSTGRIHSSFNQTVTATGRISSTEPNMQNIPVRYALGREVRKMFVAKEGCVLVDADYSQIELRILAHIAHDTDMLKAFEDGVDIHAVTASQVLGLPLEEVSDEMRSNAKAVNFGIVYGIGEFSLAKELHISVYEAKRYIDGYLEHYRGVSEYMQKIKAEAYENGFVKTLFGRIRYIPELKASNHNLRAFGERVALNTPIQGTAADIIKLAMVRVYNRLKAEGLKSKLILQVHDELIVEAYEDEAERVKQILTYEMENVIKLDVPLVAEAKSAKSWYGAK